MPKSGTLQSARPSHRALLAWVIALLIVSVIFGGASRENPLRVMLVELASLPVLYLAVRRLSAQDGWANLAGPICLLLAMAAVPLLQLIPLPPSVWQGLPLRDTATQVLAAAAVTPGWLPFSLTPADTHASLLALVAPAAMFLAVQSADADETRALAGLYLVLAVAGLVLGSGQLLSSGSSPFYLYSNTNYGSLVGFFANRNHQASFLLLCLPFAAVYVARRGRGDRAGLMANAALGFILLAIVALGAVHSRAGLILAAPALLGCLAIIWRSGTGHARPQAILVAGGSMLAAVGAVLAFALVPNLARLSADPGQEVRLQAWPYIQNLATQYLPFGSGIGSFDRVYRNAEPLELVTPTFLNHAHNDYLQLWLEAGWAGAAVLTLVVAWLVWVSFKAWRAPIGAMFDLQRAASVAVALALAHSFVDYPLRTLTMAVFFAFCCGILAWVPPTVAAHQRRSANLRTDVPLDAT